MKNFRKFTALFLAVLMCVQVLATEGFLVFADDYAAGGTPMGSMGIVKSLSPEGAGALTIAGTLSEDGGGLDLTFALNLNKAFLTDTILESVGIVNPAEITEELTEEVSEGAEITEGSSTSSSDGALDYASLAEISFEIGSAAFAPDGAVFNFADSNAVSDVVPSGNGTYKVILDSAYVYGVLSDLTETDIIPVIGTATVPFSDALMDYVTASGLVINIVTDGENLTVELADEVIPAAAEEIPPVEEVFGAMETFVTYDMGIMDIPLYQQSALPDLSEMGFGVTLDSAAGTFEVEYHVRLKQDVMKDIIFQISEMGLDYDQPDFWKNIFEPLDFEVAIPANSAYKYYDESFPHQLEFVNNTTAYFTIDKYTDGPIGEMTFSENASGDLVASVNLYEDIIYGELMNDVNFFGSFDLAFDGDLDHNEVPRLVPREDGIPGFSVAWDKKSGTGEPGGGAYSVDKSSTRATDDGDTSPEIVYTIVYEAEEGKSLSGTKLVDKLSANNLTITGFTYKIDYVSGSGAPLESVDGTLDLAGADADQWGDYVFSSSYDPASAAAPVPANTDGTNGMVFAYETPIDTTKHAVKVTLTLNTMIEMGTYQKIISGNAVTMNNTASLYNREDGYSKSVDDKADPIGIQFTYFNKTGERSVEDRDVIDWTLEGETYWVLQDNDVFIVDRIPNNAVHNYETTKAVKISYDGLAEPITAMPVPGGTQQTFPQYMADFDGKEMNNAAAMDKIRDLLTEANLYGDGNPAPPQAYIYEYFNSSTGLNESVMVIRLHKEAVNGPFMITYSTRMGELKINSGTAAESVVENDVTMFISPNVYGPGGPGPGGVWPQPFGGVSAKEGITIGRDVVTKHGIEQLTGAGDHLVRWKIGINDRGVDFGVGLPLNIIDTFDHSKMVLVGIGGDVGGTNAASKPVGQNLTLTSSNGKTLNVPYVTTALGSGNYYMYAEKTPGVYELIINITDPILSADYYEIMLETKVVDPAIMTVNTTTGEATNSLIYTSEYEGTHSPRPIEAKMDVKSAILAKAVNKPYEFQDIGTSDYEGVIEWKVTVNAEKMKIQDAILTDTLPAELELIGNVYYDTAYGAHTINSYAANPAGDQITINFGEITDVVTIILKTKVKEAFKADDSFFVGTKTFENNVNLSGKLMKVASVTGGVITYSDTDGVAFANANAKASTVVKFEAFSKRAEYFEGRRYNPKTAEFEKEGAPDADAILANVFSWSIAFNGEKYRDLEDSKISDTVNKGAEDNYALNPKSLKVYTLNIAALLAEDPPINIVAGDASKNIPVGTIDLTKIKDGDGRVLPQYKTQVPAAAIPDLDVDASGFSFTVTNAMASEVILIEYDTIIITTEMIKEGDVVNHVTLEYAGSRKDELDKVVYYNEGSTNSINKVAFATFVPSFTLFKSTTKTRYIAPSLIPSQYIAGIEYTLTPYTIDGGTVTPSVPMPITKEVDGKVASRTTNASGTANFLLIDPDRIYKLEEILTSEQAALYETPKPRYFYAPEDSDDAAALDGQLRVVDGGTTYDVEMVAVTFGSYKPYVFYTTLPDDGTVTAAGRLIDSNVKRNTVVELNKPKGGTASDILFTKLDEAGDAFAGVKFRFQAKPPLSSAIFSNVDVVTNGAGQITLEAPELKEIDRSNGASYILTEIPVADTAYSRTEYQFTLTFSDNGKATVEPITTAANDGPTVRHEAGVPDVIQNYHVRGTVSINKVNDATGALIRNATPDNRAVFKVYKKDAPNELVAYLSDPNNDGKYTLSNSSGNSSFTDIITSKALRQTGSIWQLLPGDYYAVEVKAPSGFALGDANNGGNPNVQDPSAISAGGDIKYEFTIEAGGETLTLNSGAASIRNFPNTYSFKAEKLSLQESTKINGFVFRLYAYDEDDMGAALNGNTIEKLSRHNDSTLNTHLIDRTFTTINGEVNINNLVKGTYVLVEDWDSIGNGYKVPVSESDFQKIARIITVNTDGSVTVGGAVVTSVKFNNEKAQPRGRVRLDKVSTKGSTADLTAAVFEVFDGTKEVGFIVYDGTAFRITPTYGSADFTGETNGFGVKYLDKAYVATTQEWQLLPGDYTVREIENAAAHVQLGTDGIPLGVLESDAGRTAKSFTLTIGQNDDAEYYVKDGSDTDILNIYSGLLTINGLKVSKNKKVADQKPLAGMVFDLYAVPRDKTHAEIDKANLSEMSDYFVARSNSSGADGGFTFTLESPRKIADGKYIIAEYSAPSEYKCDARVYISVVGGEVFILGDTDPTSPIKVENERDVTRGRVTLTKASSNPDVVPNVGGALFEVYAKFGDVQDRPVAYIRQIGSAYVLSNSDGAATLAEEKTADAPGASAANVNVQYPYLRNFAEINASPSYSDYRLLTGEYFAVEVQAATGHYGYLADGKLNFDGETEYGKLKKYPFTVTTADNEIDLDTPAINVVNEFIVASEDIGGEKITLGGHKVSDVTMGLYWVASFAETSPDAADLIKSELGNPVDTDVTKTDGSFTLNGIATGYYVLKEHSSVGAKVNGVSINYSVSPERYLYVIDEDGDVTQLAYSEDGVNIVVGHEYTSAIITNVRENPRARVELDKVDEDTALKLYGAEFTVYTKADRTAVAYINDGVTATVYALSKTSISDKPELDVTNGSGVPYLSDEIGVLELLNGEYYLVETTSPMCYTAEAGAEYPLIIAEEDDATVVSLGEIENERTPGRIYGFKVDQGGRGLPGATIALFDAGNNEIARQVTGNDGSYEFLTIPVGTYTVRELIAPAGFVRSPAVFTVTVTGDGGVSGQQWEEIRVSDFVNVRTGDPYIPPAETTAPTETTEPSETTESPSETEKPDVTTEPDVTTSPKETTESPEDTKSPEETTGPDEETASPEETTSPDETKTPEDPADPPVIPNVPEGYTVELMPEGYYMVYDENGVPLGFFYLPEGESLETFDIMGNLIPLGQLPYSPQTGDIPRNLLVFNCFLFGSLIIINVLLTIADRKRKASGVKSKAKNKKVWY